MLVAREDGNRRGIVQLLGVGLFILALAHASGQTLPDKNVSTASWMPTPEHGHATTLAVDPRCDLCREPGAPRWVFVIATGRSGSTTALAMLNGVPGFYLAGEDRKQPVGLLRKAWHARTFGDAANEAEKKKNERESVNAGAAAPHGRALERIKAFHKLGFGTSGPSIYEPLGRAGAAGLCDAQRALKARLNLAAPPTDARALGFKHIRDVREYDGEDLNFLAALFPCARFVLTFRRDLEAQRHSGFRDKANDGGEREIEATEELRKETATLLAWGREQHNKKRVFEMELESVSLERYNALLTWLNVTDCRFTRLLAANQKGGSSENDNVCECSWPIYYWRPD